MRRRALIGNDIPAEREAEIETRGGVSFQFSLTTRKGGYTINYQDGMAIVDGFQGLNTNRLFPNSDPRVIKLWFKNGVQAVDTISFVLGSKALKITDLGTFLNQFPKLRVITLRTETSTTSEISGDIADISDGLEEFYYENIFIINTPERLHWNLSRCSLTSVLKKFAKGVSGVSAGYIIIYGDLAKLPKTVEYLDFSTVIWNQGVSYSGGKIWAAETDYINLQGCWFTPTEKDDILNDMANSITTAVGLKRLLIPGFRTSASDSAYSYLVGLGFDVPETEIVDPNSLTSADFKVNASYFSPAVSFASLIGYPIFPYGREWNNNSWYIGQKWFQIMDSADGTSVKWNSGFELSIYFLNADFSINKIQSQLNGATGVTINTPYWMIGHIRQNPQAVTDETIFPSVGLVVT